MKISEFHFEVPSELIALSPLLPRSDARLLAYHRDRGEIRHSTFKDLPEFLKAGDLLVFNNTYVIPARFYGRRQTGGEIEGLMLDLPESNAFAWIKGKANPGDQLHIDGFRAVSVVARAGKRVELSCGRDELAAALKNSGCVPIPPYIMAERRKSGIKVEAALDKQNYQSIFAKEARGFSVAAPTASLHFDEELLTNLHAKGIETTAVTLHVGEGTFAPVEVENLDAHRMHSERVVISEEVWQKIEETRARGGRVIAVGTTVCRSLEAASRLHPSERMSFSTDLFIRPPFEFKMVDALLTNFHWPDSTLVVLVATFLEAKLGKCAIEMQHDWRRIYSEAISLRYRLFSYGDGMLIL